MKESNKAQKYQFYCSLWGKMLWDLGNIRPKAPSLHMLEVFVSIRGPSPLLPYRKGQYGR